MSNSNIVNVAELPDLRNKLVKDETGQYYRPLFITYDPLSVGARVEVAVLDAKGNIGGRPIKGLTFFDAPVLKAGMPVLVVSATAGDGVPPYEATLRDMDVAGSTATVQRDKPLNGLIKFETVDLLLLRKRT